MSIRLTYPITGAGRYNYNHSRRLLQRVDTGTGFKTIVQLLSMEMQKLNLIHLIILLGNSKRYGNSAGLLTASTDELNAWNQYNGSSAWCDAMYIDKHRLVHRRSAVDGNKALQM